MGNASTKERSLTPPHGNHQQSTTANLSRRGGAAAPSGSGRLPGTVLGGGGGAAAEGLTGRGRQRNAVEGAMFSLGIPGRERDREAEREAREQRKAEREKERQKERERSLREESLDGGFLVTQGVYTGVEDFKEKIVRQLMIERRLAPFFKGLSDHEPNWTDAQLVAAVKGLPIPPADTQVELELPRSPSPKKSFGPSDSANNLTVPIPSRSRAHSYTSEGSGSGPSTPAFSFSSRSRAKTFSIPSPRLPGATGLPVELNDPSRVVDGRPIEAVLYQSAVECPICFLYYPPYLNRTRCCDQEICSECFVQIKRPDPHLPEHHDDQPTPNPNTADQLISEPATCPFCVEVEFGVIYTPPPFRRGLQYSTASSPPSPVSGTPTSTSLPTIPSPSPTGRRLALSVNSPEVVTTDRIRPDWAQKLATARSHAARRAAAATALHTAAYLMSPSSSPSASNTPPPTFATRRLIRRSPPIDQLPSPLFPPSSSATNNPGPAETFLSRRGRMVDLEEMMLLEAIRLSLAEEEERKSRPQPQPQPQLQPQPQSPRENENDSNGKGKSVDRSPAMEDYSSSSGEEGGLCSSGGMFALRSLQEMAGEEEARMWGGEGGGGEVGDGGEEIERDAVGNGKGKVVAH